MPRPDTPYALRRDLGEFLDEFQRECDTRGIALECPITKPVPQYSTRELKELSARLGVKPRGVGRPQEVTDASVIAIVESIMRMGGRERSVLGACRWLARIRGWPSARSIARRYYRAKQQQKK